MRALARTRATWAGAGQASQDGEGSALWVPWSEGLGEVSFR